MKRFQKFFATAAAMTAFAATSTQAQTTCGPDGVGNLAVNAVACSQTHTLNATVNDILRLTVSTAATGLNSPASVNFGALAGNAYLTSATALAAAAGPNVKVVANRAYEVSIAASTANFGTAPAGVSKPAGDVEWMKTAGTMAALSTTAAVVLSGTTGTADTNTDLSFQSRWAFERDVPGSYALQVTLTLAAK